MSYEDKMEAARQFLLAYYERIKQHLAVSPESQTKAILDDLLLLGASTEESLSKLSWEDVINHLPPVKGIRPTLVAKDLCKIFRSGSEANTEQTTKPYLSAGKVQQLSPRELIEAYNPSDPNNRVGQRLKEISRERPFLVFDDDGKVNVGVSEKLLGHVMDGHNGTDIYTVDRDPVRVYKVGNRPASLVNENPIYPGRALMGEWCDQLNRSWEGIPLSVRQFVRLVVESEKNISIDKAHTLLDFALNGMSPMVERYPHVALAFRRQEKDGDLPKLRIALDSVTNKAASNWMAEGKKVQFGGSK